MAEPAPQYDPDAEASVLGSILIDDSKISKVREILTGDDFYAEKHKWIFRAMEALSTQGTGIDIITLHNFLQNEGFIEVVGGAAYLSELTNHVPTSVRVLDYANIVAKDSAKRKIKQAADRIGKASEDGSTSLEDTLKLVQE